ncbi:hypothetical protein K443DRAFT_132504 [Laccaria amethystina LaAM-08-1]|uniref:Unplaced genomic scaffold K443scaffold_80, whole genome shotgun sequence n=1 Tax=Laccaria amethystina LaAM-08-1 TaxID=1095629 RepID=A0A0C9WR61_9AGAR|nr:hypothetical protein K443DRAFT_132504 [Laccaria amethystina LaAM-08-1]
MERLLPGEEAKAFSEDVKRLEGRNNLTYLMDGWDDSQRRSIYGCMIAEVAEFPVVLGVEELTGIRATADNLCDVATKALAKKSVDPKSIIAVCTDNPTPMVAFCRKWTNEYPWILYPTIKKTVTSNSRIVSFFNASHYWGGQLEIVAKENKVTHGLKTNTESRFYVLILQALNIRDHKASLTTLCLRHDAQHSVGGLTPVARDVVTTVFDINRWQRTDQLIRVCKPLVDIIGDLIWAHREVTRLPLKSGDDSGFLRHAQQILNTQFHEMNTDLHWISLFLHPLCRKLAISNSRHSRKLEDAYKISLTIASRWGWSKEMATALLRDIKGYFHVQAPFQGGKADGRDWWKSLLVNVTSHPLKALAIKLFSIVPHAAEVERFFSNLVGIQSVKCSSLTVPHMETLGTLRNHYTRHLLEEAIKAGKSTRRKHAHMHTQADGGINVERAEDLIWAFNWTPLPANFNSDLGVVPTIHII